ncbi:MAG: hypothetical protein AAGK23_11200, partial [Pseudomonadota bacterium]
MPPLKYATRTFCIGLISAFAIAGAAADHDTVEEAPEFVDTGTALARALKSSKVIANARIRYEHADFSNFDNNADAFTFRLRLGAETGAFFDTKFLAEFEYVEAFNDNFNSTRNGVTDFPVVADPEA